MNSAFTLNHETNLPGQKGEPGGRRRMTVQVMPGPAVRITTLRGWRGWPFVAQAHLRQRRISLRLRLRLEGLPFWPSFGGMPPGSRGDVAALIKDFRSGGKLQERALLPATRRPGTLPRPGGPRPWLACGYSASCRRIPWREAGSLRGRAWVPEGFDFLAFRTARVNGELLPPPRHHGRPGRRWRRSIPHRRNQPSPDRRL